MSSWVDCLDRMMQFFDALGDVDAHACKNYILDVVYHGNQWSARDVRWRIGACVDMNIFNVCDLADLLTEDQEERLG